MRTKTFTLIIFFGFCLLAKAQTNPNSLMGLPTLPTLAIMNAITTGPAGNSVYNLEDQKFYTFNGINWIAVNGANTNFAVNGTNLEITDDKGTLAVPLSSLVDHDWYQANTTDQATDINQSIYTLSNIGIGTNNPTRAIHLAGNNAVMRLSKSSNTATLIFDRYSGTIDNTLKSFQFGLDASSTGLGEFFFADYNENVAGGDFTKIMSFTDGDDFIKFNQYGIGNFDNNTPTRLLGVEADGGVIEVDPTTVGTDNQDIDILTLNTTTNMLTVGIQDGADLTVDLSALIRPLIIEKTSNYTLVPSDDSNVFTFNSLTDVTLTIPTGLPLGFNISIYQTGVGKVLFSGTSGATVKNRLLRFKTAGLNAGAGLISTGTNIFHLTGDLKR